MEIIYISEYVVIFLYLFALLFLYLVIRFFHHSVKPFLYIPLFLTAIVILFYFIIPVPLYAKEKEFNFLYNLILNNKGFTTENIRSKSFSMCSKNLKAYQFFDYKDALKQDIYDNANKLGMVRFGEIKKTSGKDFYIFCLNEEK